MRSTILRRVIAHGPARKSRQPTAGRMKPAKAMTIVHCTRATHAVRTNRTDAPSRPITTNRMICSRRSVDTARHARHPRMQGQLVKAIRDASAPAHRTVTINPLIPRRIARAVVVNAGGSHPLPRTPKAGRPCRERPRWSSCQVHS